MKIQATKTKPKFTMLFALAVNGLCRNSSDVGGYP